jgi:hypothetical protein
MRADQRRSFGGLLNRGALYQGIGRQIFSLRKVDERIL